MMWLLMRLAVLVAPLPPWLRGLFQAIFEVIRSMPKGQREEVTKEIKDAVKKWREDDDPTHLKKIADKYCEGTGCPPSLK